VKRLTVLRHAKSSWDDPKLDDFDRPLNDRGWKAARRMGRELSTRGMEFDFVLASPAERVRQTLDGLREKFELRAEIRFERSVYMASEATLLELIRTLPETVKRPLLVGHNPGLQNLVFGLTGDDRVAGKFPTAALAGIELAIQRWTDVARRSGTLADLIFPRDLD